MRSRAGCLVVVAAVLLLCASGAGAATLTVTTTNDSITPGDGQCSLREAIAAANAPGTATDCGTADATSNTIVLGPSEYLLSIQAALPTDDNTTGDLDITSTVPLTIKGAGAGATDISGANAEDRVFHVLAGANVTIEDLEISNGHAPDGVDAPVGEGVGGTGFSGGGVYNGGTLSLDRVKLDNDTAGSGGEGGGGVDQATDSTLDAADGGIAGAGGGIYNTGTLTLTDVSLIDDAGGTGGIGGQGGTGESSAIGGTGGIGGDGGSGGAGGGLDNDGGTVTITASTFAGDHAGPGGAGGAGGQGGSGTGGLGSSDGSGGPAGSGVAGAPGGALASSGGSLTIVNTTLDANAGGVGGAGGNGGAGGGILSLHGTGGAAGDGGSGGGVYVGGGMATLTNATVTADQVGAAGSPGTGSQDGAAGSAPPGGGVYLSVTPAAQLLNTLLASNGGGNCAGAAPIDLGHNLSFGDATCPAGFASGDPKLGTLKDNGGPTETIAIASGGAAVDQVPTAGAGCPATDQRGVVRPQGPACDIGAYELAPPEVSISAATSLATTTATIQGSVTPNQASAQIHFEYGTAATFGSSSPVQSFGGLQAQPVTAGLSGLKPHTIYHYRLVATSADGTTDSPSGTFTTATLPTPRLSGLAIKKKTISYRDTESASTTFTVFRATAGVRHGKRCVPKKGKLARGRRCALLLKLGSFTHVDKAGANKISLPARIDGHKLARGTYAITATPRLGSAVGRSVSVSFKI
jgi:CSLREA domain-containing protein